MDSPQTIPTQEASGEKPEFVRLVFSLGREARFLAQPVFCCAALSLGGALLSWSFCFYAYIFDSFKSFLVCALILMIVAVPGAFLFWLYRSLREISRLPSCLRLAGGVDEEPARGADWQASEGPAPTNWFGRFKARMERVLELWELLSDFQQELLRLSGPSLWLIFLAKPASIFIIAAAFLASAFLVLGAILATVQGMFSAIV